MMKKNKTSKGIVNLLQIKKAEVFDVGLKCRGLNKPYDRLLNTHKLLIEKKKAITNLRKTIDLEIFVNNQSTLFFKKSFSLCYVTQRKTFFEKNKYFNKKKDNGFIMLFGLSALKSIRKNG